MAAALTAFQAGGGAELFVVRRRPARRRAGGAPRRPRRRRRAAPTSWSAATSARRLALPARRLLQPPHRPLRAAPARPGASRSTRTGTTPAPRRPTDHVVADGRGEPADDGSVRGAGYDGRRAARAGRPTGDLEAARFLVVAGRGAGSRGGVERLAAAAARMGAAFGVTRPVVMNAWAAPDRQIGVSGTRTAPAVCLVAGASGAPAFLWGVERAGFIAAVDTDEHAAIVARGRRRRPRTTPSPSSRRSPTSSPASAPEPHRAALHGQSDTVSPPFGGRMFASALD